MITIGQLADYAGVTRKAIRHYHQRGLLEEPPRDASGYRRYTAKHAIALVKIMTPAEAGVPLARIQELLGANREGFDAAIAEIDHALRQQIEDLNRTRERLAHLRGGDDVFVSFEVADYLRQLHVLGVGERTVALERDIWALMQSVSPKAAASWIADKRDALNDAEFRAIYREYDAAIDWTADDPRLDRLAERMERWMANRSRPSNGMDQVLTDATIAELVTTSFGAISPAWDRLTDIIQERKERQ